MYEKLWTMHVGVFNACNIYVTVIHMTVIHMTTVT